MDERGGMTHGGLVGDGHAADGAALVLVGREVVARRVEGRLALGRAALAEAEQDREGVQPVRTIASSSQLSLLVATVLSVATHLPRTKPSPTAMLLEGSLT